MNKETDKNNKELRLTIRFYNVDDVARLNKWKKQVSLAGDSFSNVLSRVIMNYLDDTEKKKVLKDFKTDLFYAFRKSMFASLTPFSANIIENILSIKADNYIINKKLDLLLNSIASDKDLTKSLLRNPTQDLIEEVEFFRNLRNLLNVKNDKVIETKNEKVARIKKQEEKYENYEFEDGLFEPEVLDSSIDAMKGEFDE
ncbi:integrative conjugal element protein [Mycoplasmopsis caviae]|uniref:Integrative conjugal element protein n=1 Tax=Mycoplasmopsis caviae TaxID=55603 RepID=A0A3P8KN95_9BACT|nr:integrative conjugal element protein [Mycoplasmopsis caviae]UUD34809.1 integrative conjugal element protein [Mycoplasmopsis caviae]VDR42338.1 Uncharacterised protein [Mycoplasmopsis caviae]